MYCYRPGECNSSSQTFLVLIILSQGKQISAENVHEGCTHNFIRSVMEGASNSAWFVYPPQYLTYIDHAWPLLYEVVSIILCIIDSEIIWGGIVVILYSRKFLRLIFCEWKPIHKNFHPQKFLLCTWKMYTRHCAWSKWTLPRGGGALSALYGQHSC